MTYETSPAAKDKSGFRLGIDLGGTKIAGIALDRYGQIRADCRIAAPQQDYAATIDALTSVVAGLERDAGGRGSIGIGMPGSISPSTGLVQNANSTWLNGRSLKSDLEARLGRPVRLANDANCFTLSEATDGAAMGAGIVFGVIIGTGCGGGIVINGQLLDGPRGIGGEWGHNPLPWTNSDEGPGPRCWCGRSGCMETWVSGPAMAADHARVTGEHVTAAEIAQRALDGDMNANATLARHASRLARGLAHVVNLIDPHVIVLGGGLSQIYSLYRALPAIMNNYVLADDPRVDIRPPKWGDASGVRGAAWLWDD
ncbi:MAG: ROK family protein [Hyphomicrobiaceae bacterium]